MEALRPTMLYQCLCQEVSIHALLSMFQKYNFQISFTGSLGWCFVFHSATRFLQMHTVASLLRLSRYLSNEWIFIFFTIFSFKLSDCVYLVGWKLKFRLAKATPISSLSFGIWNCTQFVKKPSVQILENVGEERRELLQRQSWSLGIHVQEVSPQRYLQSLG